MSRRFRPLARPALLKAMRRRTAAGVGGGVAGGEAGDRAAVLPPRDDARAGRGGAGAAGGDAQVAAARGAVGVAGAAGEGGGEVTLDRPGLEEELARLTEWRGGDRALWERALERRGTGAAPGRWGR